MLHVPPGKLKETSLEIKFVHILYTKCLKLGAQSQGIKVIIALMRPRNKRTCSGNRLYELFK